MRTKTELKLEQTQQGVSDEVLVGIEGVEELKRKVKIKDSRHGPSDAMHNPSQPLKSDTKVFTVTMEILPEPTSNKLCEEDCGMPYKIRIGGNDESKKMQKVYLEAIVVKEILCIHSEGSSQSSGIVSFDDLYNNLRVFENDVKGLYWHHLLLCKDVRICLEKHQQIKGNQDNKRRESDRTPRNKDGSRTGKKEDSKAIWLNNPLPELDIKLIRSIEMERHNSQGLKKFEAQIVSHQPRSTLLVLLGEKGKLLLSPQQVVIRDHKDTTGIMSPNTMVDPVLEIDYPHRALKNKGIVDSGCSKHMTGNKAYLA
ncbi:hypothetical protein Tco_0815609 [Tanacetum coccineum]